MNKVAAFYQFLRLEQPEAVREEFLHAVRRRHYGGRCW